MTLYLSVLFAALIYVLIDFLGTEGAEIFTKKYVGSLLVNLAAGSYLVWSLDLQPGQFEVGGVDLLVIVAGAFGVFGQKLFKSIMQMINKKIKTKIGRNA
jgi:hypothetical protein